MGAGSDLTRRHMLAECFLVDVLGLAWSQVHHDADRVAAIMSSHVEARLWELLEMPGTCPHGNPIPGSPNAPDQRAAIRLADATGPVTVTRVAEQVEHDHEAMVLLERGGMTPGRLAEVRGRVDGGVDVVGATCDAIVPEHVAQHVYVTPYQLGG